MVLKIKMVSGNLGFSTSSSHLLYNTGLLSRPSVFCLFVCCCCLYDWFAFVNMKWGQFTLLRKGNIDLNSCMYVTYWEREGKINRGCMLWSSTQVWFSVCVYVCVHPLYTYIITCIFLYEYVYNLIQTWHFRGLNTLVGLKLTLIDCKINNDNTLYGSAE